MEETDNNNDSIEKESKDIINSENIFDNSNNKTIIKNKII